MEVQGPGLAIRPWRRARRRASFRWFFDPRWAGTRPGRDAGAVSGWLRGLSDWRMAVAVGQAGTGSDVVSRCFTPASTPTRPPRCLTGRAVGAVP